MSGQSIYHNRPLSNPFYSSNPSTSPSTSGQMYGSARDMLPPANMDFPPLRPMEIEVNNNSILNSSRILPSPSASAPATWGDNSLFGSHHLDTQFGASNIPRSHHQAEPSVRTSQQNPLIQWYSTNDGPWVPKQIMDGSPDERSNSRQTGNRIPQLYGQNYRSSGHVDGGPFYSVPHSDSGYGTRHSVGNTSVFSGDVNERDQDSQSILGPSTDYHSYPSYNESLQMQNHEGRASDSWSTPGSAVSPLPSTSLTCPTCLKILKTPSELKKHDLRHRKPFVCTVHGCKRVGGFSTSNDLERHSKSKHPALKDLASTKRFRCMVSGCKSKDKAWPRLDNFRSHLKRVHGSCFSTEQDYEEIVRRGEYMDDNQEIEHYDSSHEVQHEFTEEPATAEVVSRQGNAWRNPEDVRSSHDPIPSNGSVLEVPFYPSHPNQERSSFPEPSLQETVKPVEVFPRQVTNISTICSPLHKDTSEKIGPIDPALTSLESSHPSGTHTGGKAEKGVAISASDPTIIEAVKKALAAVNKAQNESCHNRTTDIISMPNGRFKDPNLGLRNANGLHISDDGSGLPSSELDLNNPEARRNAQALEVLNIITKLGFTLQKDPSHSVNLPEAQPTTVTLKGDKKTTCPVCKKFNGRPCELKKHMKRHSKPYGCTFAKCPKTFGSKNDWKRHENSQHFHQETFRCDITREEDGEGVCGKAFYRRQTFQEHLKNHHQMEDDEPIKDKLESCRIGRNCQSRFWCGFCASVVELKKKGTEAWNERFDHIDDHFMGKVDGNIEEGKALNIRNWVYVNSDKPRGDVDSPPSSKEGSNHEESSPEATGRTLADAIILDAVDKGKSLKRKHSDNDEEASQPSKIRKPVNRLCCECNSVNNPRFDTGCNSCDRSHPFCDACPMEYAPVPMTES